MKDIYTVLPALGALMMTALPLWFGVCLRRAAANDALTDLSSGALLTERLRQVIAQVRRASGSFVLLVIDFERLESIHSPLGHRARQRLLSVVTLRLRSALRRTDTLTRIGGEHFVIVLGDAQYPLDAGFALDELLSGLSRPMELAGREGQVTPGVGISIYPRDGGDPLTLLRHANAAVRATQAVATQACSSIKQLAS